MAFHPGVALHGHPLFAAEVENTIVVVTMKLVLVPTVLYYQQQCQYVRYQHQVLPCSALSASLSAEIAVATSRSGYSHFPIADNEGLPTWS